MGEYLHRTINYFPYKVITKVTIKLSIYEFNTGTTRTLPTKVYTKYILLYL